MMVSKVQTWTCQLHMRKSNPAEVSLFPENLLLDFLLSLFTYWRPFPLLPQNYCRSPSSLDADVLPVTPPRVCLANIFPANGQIVTPLRPHSRAPPAAAHSLHPAALEEWRAGRSRVTVQAALFTSLFMAGLFWGLRQS